MHRRRSHVHGVLCWRQAHRVIDFLCARLRESFTGLVQDDQRRLDHPQEHVALDDAGRANFADASGRPPNSPPAVSTAPNRVSAIATLPPAPSAPCCLPPSPPSPRLPRRPPCHRRLRSPLPHPRRAQSDGTWYCQRSGSEPMHDCEAAARADCRMPCDVCRQAVNNPVKHVRLCIALADRVRVGVQAA